MSLAKLIRAPPTSISRLHAKITSQHQPSSFPPALSSLLQDLASRDDDGSSTADISDALSNEEYNHMMKEMVSCGNEMLKLVSEKTEKMGSEQVYDEDVLDLCT